MIKFFQTRKFMRDQIDHLELKLIANQERLEDAMKDAARSLSIIAEHHVQLQQMAITLSNNGLPMPEKVRARYVNMKLDPKTTASSLRAGLAAVSAKTTIIPPRPPRTIVRHEQEPIIRRDVDDTASILLAVAAINSIASTSDPLDAPAPAPAQKASGGGGDYAGGGASGSWDDSGSESSSRSSADSGGSTPSD